MVTESRKGVSYAAILDLQLGCIVEVETEAAREDKSAGIADFSPRDAAENYKRGRRDGHAEHYFFLHLPTYSRGLMINITNPQSLQPILSLKPASTVAAGAVKFGTEI